MTLREELEILRGEPIQVFTGDPQEIPCNETSDSEKLCKNPMVSVWMITYNHEPYIRQAIEGVVMQKTDFEYELVIGEDCSTDRTREICFEYQRKYPDKIRVLWSNQNLYRNPHPAGGNSQRTMAHCRGEFIAFCEGDDYWIDPLKLQKQVDIMRKHPTVGLCFSKYMTFYQRTDFVCSRTNQRLPFGMIPSQKAFLWLLYGMNPHYKREEYIHTANVLLRHSTLNEAFHRYADLFSMALCLGDLQMWLSVSSLSDIYFLEDYTAIYRSGGGGIMSSRMSASRVRRDGMLVTMYFHFKVLGLLPLDIPDFIIDDYLFSTAVYLSLKNASQAEQMQFIESLKGSLIGSEICRRNRSSYVQRCLRRGKISRFADVHYYDVKMSAFHGIHISRSLTAYYLAIAKPEFEELARDFTARAKMTTRVLNFLRKIRCLLTH